MNQRYTFRFKNKKPEALKTLLITTTLGKSNEKQKNKQLL